MDPLNEYAMSGQVEEMRTYLDRNPESVHKKNKDFDVYPLEYSITFININRHVEVFKLLLERGARYDIVNHDENNPVSAMELVATTHNLEAMEALMAAGEQRRSARALHNALSCTKSQNALIITGATHQDTKYVRDELGFIKWMLKNGWNIHQELDDGTTPLMTALEHCSLEIVEYLVKQGADLKKENKIGLDAIYFAVKSNDSKKLQYLMDKGLKPKNKKYTSSELNLLHVILNNHYAYFDKVEAEVVQMINLLVREGIDINAKQKDNLYTPLTWAAYHGGTTFVALLVQLGAEVNSLNSAGETPLDVTVKPPIVYTQKATEKVLVSAGGVYRRYGPQKEAPQKTQSDNSELWGVLGGLGASAVGFKSGLSEAASVDVGVRMAESIKNDNVTIENFKANPALTPKKTATTSTNAKTKTAAATSSKMNVANKDYNVDKNARSQFAGTYANTYFDKATADYRYVLNGDGSAKLYTRACENCTHDLQGQGMSRDWKESYQVVEWAPMLDDKKNPLVVQVKDMYDKSYQARALLVVLQGGKTMILKHYTDSTGPALLGSYGVALYKN